MSGPRFRELVDRAIEHGRPLDTPEFSRLARGASPNDQAYWRSQVRLDRSIDVWCGRSKVAGRRRFPLLSSVAAVSIAAVVLTVVWRTPSGPVATQTPFPRTQTIAVSAIDAAVDTSESAPRRVVEASAAKDRRFAEATATAERLAYAFQPVGEQVGSVMRLLMDSVPGAEVLSM